MQENVDELNQRRLVTRRLASAARARLPSVDDRGVGCVFMQYVHGRGLLICMVRPMTGPSGWRPDRTLRGPGKWQ